MDIDQLKKQFIQKYNLDSNTIFFLYGSRLYGTNKPESDYDFISVVSNDSSVPTGTEYRNGNIDIHVYKFDDFQEQLNLHKIQMLECWYQPDSIAPKHFKFKLNLPTLRESLSEKASHSFVKAKKKIEVEKDYYIGWKSLFHSLRILNFGIQIVKFNRIYFTQFNDHWYDILNANQYDWAYFKETYQPIYNSLASEFRKLAPK